MDKFFLVSLLGLLIAAHGVAGSITCDNIAMLDELVSLDTEEENEVELSDIPSWRSERGGKVLVNVDSFGAAGDGESDDTEVSSFITINYYYWDIPGIANASPCLWSIVLLSMHFTHLTMLDKCFGCTNQPLVCNVLMFCPFSFLMVLYIRLFEKHGMFLALRQNLFS